MIPTPFSKISISAHSKAVKAFFVRFSTHSLQICILISLLSFFSFTSSAQYQSLCWQISGHGLKHPAYLYGTMHVSDKSVFNFGDKTNKAFADSKVYAMELNPAKTLSLTALTQMIMTGGNKISKLIPDSDYHFLDSVVSITNKSGMVLLNGVEPIIVSAVLDEYSMGISKSADDNMDEAMDLYFYTKAKKTRKKVIGIETMDEQIAALHALNYQEQAQMLIQSIEELKKGEQNSNADLMKFYIAQNLDSILYMSDDNQMPPKLYKALITDRNIRMADRIDGFIHNKPVFIAVGAMHLPGDGGVIALLRKKGYKVVPWR
jgi:uncharacterized protein YbaP (TraB family)